MSTRSIPQLTTDTFSSRVLHSDIPVVVDFWADWCQPCHMLAPTIDAIAERYGGRITVAKLNIDDAREIAAEYEISSIPSVLVFDGGEVVERVVGVQPIDAYTGLIDTLLEQRRVA